MGISPLRRGDLAPNLSLTWTDDSGAVVNLTGVNPTTCTLTMRETRTGAQRSGSGTFAIPAPTLGQLTYQWAAPDTASTGVWRVYATIILPSGAPQSCDEIEVVIL